MRKLNSLRTQETNAVPASPEPHLTTSWMPMHSLQTVALDPARWSERVRQRRQWQFIEAQRRRMH